VKCSTIGLSLVMSWWSGFRFLMYAFGTSIFVIHCVIIIWGVYVCFGHNLYMVMTYTLFGMTKIYLILFFLSSWNVSMLLKC